MTYFYRVKKNPRKHGNKSLRALGPHLWNSLAEKMKSTTSIFIFKDFIKTWFGLTLYLSYCILEPKQHYKGGGEDLGRYPFLNWF